MVSADRGALWSPAEMVALYRERMQIEQSFPDFKTHTSGCAASSSKSGSPNGWGRLLLAFWLAYALLLFLGTTPEGKVARQDLEILRRQPRHRTARAQSVLSIARLMLYRPQYARRAFHALSRLLARLARGITVIPESVLCPPLATGLPGT